MKFRILNGEPLQFYNAQGALIGTIEIDTAGAMFIRANSGSGDITIGDPDTTGDVQIGTTAAPTTLTLMGGGTISANGNALIIGNDSIGDRVSIRNATFTQSLAITGSLRVTGSAYANTFIGSGAGLTYVTASYVNTLNQAVIITGSLRNRVLNITPSNQSASIDCSNSNMFDLTLSSSVNTLVTATNIQPGQTINLRVTQPSTSGSISFNASQFKFPAGIPYTASAANSAVDIVSFVAFDSVTLYGTAIKNLS